MLGLHHGSVVSADTLVELLWGEDPPRTAAKALQTHISALRRALGDGFVLTQGTGWAVAESDVDASRYKSAARLGRDAAATGDTLPCLRATYDVAPNVKGHLEAVHRLGSLGVVITELVSGTSEQGFALQRREVGLIAFEGDLVSRF
jgi:Transcriptional regulatory protein, C terminal